MLFVVIKLVFKEKLINKKKETGFITSIFLLIAYTACSYQKIVIPQFIETKDFEILKFVLMSLVSVSILIDKKEDLIFRKIITLFLLASNKTEFQASFLLAALAVEGTLQSRHVSFKYLSISLLLIVSTLFGLWAKDGLAVLASLFAIILVIDQRKSTHKTQPYNSLFYGIVLVTFSQGVLYSDLWIPLILITFIFLFDLGNNLLRNETDSLKPYISLTYLSFSALALCGHFQIFYFMSIFIFIISFLSERYFKSLFHWKFFFLLLFFSPPFGIGYMIRIEVLEKVISHSSYAVLAISLFYLAIQFCILMLTISERKMFITSIKNFTLNADILASLVIFIGIVMSVLFLPSNWIEGFGNLFTTKFFPETANNLSHHGIGYYLFWIEIVVWLSLAGIYFKTSPGFFNKLYFSIVLLGKEKPALLDQKIIIRKNLNNEKFIFDAKRLVSALEMGKNKLPPQYFSVIMLTVLGLILAGLV